MSDDRMTTFSEFWSHYVRAHSRKGTRILHAVGSVIALIIAMVAIVSNLWWILLAPLVGYGFAWYSHFYVEHNKPATFGHPFWSLAADYRMLFLTLSGRMEQHVRAARDGENEDAVMMSPEDL